ncbi:ligase-associated DNA damage response endonuclease PdeM [Scleromatobacter humisilvae]|uniref:Ligase-associated DNA damage response endonuclease PdeM n=1 Tax=Scleromatobacter humisilvae TaxID=2897159 RepID=A0A9X1YNY6_9BURK|nr:ligase-associated DNA damage response endonuclease PdeM [Scleromatobacter humisilvae]MCK9689678.1 ligase-associated DNA damage response endonuclease PdeM [Scleromatobacter humisilvae]
MNGAQLLRLDGDELWLLPERAAWHADSRTLFIADLHLGKSATFRARGLPVPSGTTLENLQRLATLVREHAAQRVVFLGDLLHSKHAQRAAAIAPLHAWRAAHAGLRCVLVRGNHESHAGDPPPSLGFEIVDEPWPVDGTAALVGCHHPQRVDVGTVLAGHWHPAITLFGPARDRQRLACFCLIDGLLVLPAFGAFTGSSPHAPPAGSTCYPVGGDRVWPGLRVD